MCILLVVYVVSRSARRPRPRRGSTTTDMASSHRNESAASRDEEEEVIVEVREVNMWQSIWDNNKGALLILISELFGSSMDAMARYLQQGGTRFHPFQVRDVLWHKTPRNILTHYFVQIIFARMAITSILSFIYMWWIKVPHFPLGDPKVRGWLVLRALFGFTGLFSLYCVF